MESIVYITVLIIFLGGVMLYFKTWNFPNRRLVDTTTLDAPIEYGNNVYYFKDRGDKFGKSLALFIETNKQLELVSIAPYVGGGSGATTYGYFVVFRSNAQR